MIEDPDKPKTKEVSSKDIELPEMNDPTGAPNDILQMNITKLEAVQPSSLFGAKEFPSPVPASEAREQYIGDTQRDPAVIETTELDLSVPVITELGDPDSPENKQDRPMWECYLTSADDKTAKVNAGVLHFPVFRDGIADKTIPIEYEGGDVPDGGEYIYAVVYVSLEQGETTEYLTYTGSPITLIASGDAPDAIAATSDSILIPVARFQREPSQNEAGATVPATLEITQYLEGSPIIDIGSRSTLALPEGTTLGDMLYWDAENSEWVILAAPTSATVLQVLSFDPLATDPVPTWIDTYDCP